MFCARCPASLACLFNLECSGEIYMVSKYPSKLFILPLNVFNATGRITFLCVCVCVCVCVNFGMQWSLQSTVDFLRNWSAAHEASQQGYGWSNPYNLGAILNWQVCLLACQECI
jgi:hypothetical protein